MRWCRLFRRCHRPFGLIGTRTTRCWGWLVATCNIAWQLLARAASAYPQSTTRERAAPAQSLAWNAPPARRTRSCMWELATHAYLADEYDLLLRDPTTRTAALPVAPPILPNRGAVRDNSGAVRHQGNGGASAPRCRSVLASAWTQEPRSPTLMSKREPPGTNFARICGGFQSMCKMPAECK